MVGVSGIGSWPGEDTAAALRFLRYEVAEDLLERDEGVTPIPYLPELPARGPGADMIGRTAHLLVEMPVDLQPHGWRLVDRPSRDGNRAGAWWREDTDYLAEVFDGWTGAFKVQVAGPWSLAADVWLPGGERVLNDAGAVRDLQESLREGISQHLAHISRLVPQAQLLVQIDEPTLPAVLRGQVRSASGYRTLRAPDQAIVQDALRETVSHVRAAGAVTVVHCCGSRPPLGLLRGAGPDAIAADATTWGPRQWESVAASIESGVHIWPGLLDTTEPEPADVEASVRPVLQAWSEVGLERWRLDNLTITPACGLAEVRDPQRWTRRTIELGRELAQAARG